MPLKIHSLAAFTSNKLYVLEDPGSAKEGVWAIDPGDSEVIIKFCERQKKRLAGILLTHHHNDHIGGVKNLVAKYSCQTMGYGARSDRLPFLQRQFQIHEEFVILGAQFKVLPAFGHTQDHVIYSCAEQNIAFTGDVIFDRGCGRLFEGSYEDAFLTLQQLASLPDATHFYCAHDYGRENKAFWDSISKPQLTQSTSQTKTTFNPQLPLDEIPLSLTHQKQTNPFFYLSAGGRLETRLGSLEGVKGFKVLRQSRDNYQAPSVKI